MKKYRKIFFILVILYFIYFIFFIPGLILQHVDVDYYNTKHYAFLTKIYEFIYIDDVLHSVFFFLLYRINYRTIMPVVILNAGNMIFGFIYYKKKWWYYLILVISILFSVLLHNYYAIEFEFEPFD